MKLILAVDAIVPPLTGIGRYTWELAKYYATPDSGLGSIRYFFAGQWVSDPHNLLNGPPRSPAFRRKGFWPRLSARLQQWHERRVIHEHVFHSPNYFLPEWVEGGIVTVHDLSVFKYPETHPVERIRHFERSFASTLARTAHIITDSEAIRHEVAGHFGWPLEKITSVRLGVPPEFRQHEREVLFEPLARYQLVPGAYTLCVSTLEPRKRIDALLAAYAELPLSLKSRFPLVLVGSEGWLSDALKQNVVRGEREGWLRYLGFVPETALPFLYAGAHAFFFPSLYEGFGLPVLEALASGVPTLTSNCSSLPEVADGAAWLVEPGDHVALRDGIARVICDDEWRATAIERGLAVASETTWTRCARRTLDICSRFA
ncbi:MULTISPECIES: glycosyltransferase family 1 protein [unclassified Burkholderia]|uniref:glycosyltransferase family 4 protein n=1 Tax=unclassified Burkholderia TaxID=2613784 RepID=UPI00158DC70F|nr:MULTISPECIES: glycosyltransferase family 1 protein [unclassified Burkholderia]